MERAADVIPLWVTEDDPPAGRQKGETFWRERRIGFNLKGKIKKHKPVGS